MNLMPCDEQSEVRVLSTLFHVDESRGFLTRAFRQLFYNSRHRAIFVAMSEIVMEHQPLDLITLSNKLTGQLTPLEVTEFTLKYDLLTNEQMEWHIEYLKELYFCRISLNISSKITDAIQKRQIESIVKLGLSFDRVKDALFRQNTRENQFARAVRTINSPLEYIPSSFPSVRKLMGGYTRKQISSIGGKSGHNKTTFSIYEAVEQIKQGLASKVLYISVDEDGEMVARRVMASQLGVSLSMMRNKEIQLDEEEVKLAVEKILSNRLIILDNITTADSASSAILDIKPDRVILDHIQEMSYGNEGISDSKIMVAASKLKQAGRIVNANVTILSQVRDKLIDERFDNKVPRPHDFLYASDLRRKSREQCVVYWEFKDTQRDSDYSFFDFIIWKSTYSETGRLKFMVDPDKATFTDQFKIARSEELPKKEGDIWTRIKEEGW